MTLADVDAIAATAGPGLIGGVMVGLVTAKALAMAGDKPLIAINHLEGHALSPRLADAELEFPYLLLLVSGGHCQLLLVEGVGQYRRLATTIDDALGEAFDKTAKILGLGYPGGPAVERLAAQGDAKAVPLPRPLLGSAEPHFSFAGLKSAVLRARGGQPRRCRHCRLVPAGRRRLRDRPHRLARCRGWRIRSRRWWSRAGSRRTPRSARAGSAGGRHGLRFVAPPLALCTDNARDDRLGGDGAAGPGRSARFRGAPRWPLDPDAAPVRGAGVKA
jgi:N6-L-threonylcarbamoyladenine synthase